MLLGCPSEDEPILYLKRLYSIDERFKWKQFKSQKVLDVDAIEDLLQEKMKELLRLKEEEARCKEEEARKAREAKEALKPPKRKKKYHYQHEKLPWDEEVNRRRQNVAFFLQSQPYRNLAEVCRFTGCSFALVRRVADDLAFNGQVSTFVYPNQKSEEELLQLRGEHRHSEWKLCNDSRLEEEEQNVLSRVHSERAESHRTQVVEGATD